VRLDRDTTARRAPNDAQRIQRAIEVVRATGRPMGESFAQQTTESLPCRTLSLALAPPDRPALHERITQRFDAVLAADFIAVDGARLLVPQQTAAALHEGDTPN
jgi:tRNA dimethylallyltransferase